MPKTNKSLLTRLLIWRMKHISHKQFVMAISIVVGFLLVLEPCLSKHYTSSKPSWKVNWWGLSHRILLYFPIIGFGLVYIYITYVLRNKVNHGIPSTLYAISKKKGDATFSNVRKSYSGPITVGFRRVRRIGRTNGGYRCCHELNLSRLLHLNQSTRNLLIGCAAAGAMASIFKAPIAAIIFAIEVFSLDLTLVSLIPLLLASVSAIITSYFFSEMTSSYRLILKIDLR